MHYFRRIVYAGSVGESDGIVEGKKIGSQREGWLIDLGWSPQGPEPVTSSISYRRHIQLNR